MKHTLSVMDSSGDRRVQWEEDDPAAMEEAKALFDRIREKGGSVFYEQKDGLGGGRIDVFDPKADMIGVPLLIGG